MERKSKNLDRNVRSGEDERGKHEGRLKRERKWKNKQGKGG